MATLSIPIAPAAERSVRRRPAPGGPVVVTSRGDASSDGAIRVAMALAIEAACAIRLVAVLDPAPFVVAEFGTIMDVPAEDSERRRRLDRGIAAQLRRIGIAPTAVAIDVRVGDPPTEIIRAAREAAARALVLGVSHHDLLDRMLGIDTAVRVARAADVPVLVVPPASTGLPRSAVVAVDFSDASVRAARAAVELFPSLDALLLTHVTPHPEPTVDAGARFERRHLVDVEGAFDRFRGSVEVAPRVAVSRHIAHGNAARELVRTARERGAELIVAGSHGRRALQRIFVGSVASALLRSSPVPVLVLPARVGAAAGDPMRAALRDPHCWPDALDEFARRNAGRRATLRTDDSAVGARTHHIDAPFLGCAFDQLDWRLAIMLGDGDASSTHFVRGISGVSELEIVSDDDGRDRALRIVHGERGAQTMLAFTT